MNPKTVNAKASNLFAVMKHMEERKIHFTLERSRPYLCLNAVMVGKRIEITVDEDDMIDVAVFKGDESVEVGLDAVLKALSEDD